MRASLLLLAALFLTSHAAAQTEPAPGIGLSASVQAGQFDIALPVWTSPSLALIPSVGFDLAQDVGTDLRVGLAARFYRRVAEVSPYFGVRGGLLRFSPAEPEDGPELDSTIDFLVGGAFGAEAFLLPAFSLGVEAQLNATFSAEESARFGNPGNLNVNTGAAVTATVYF
jgi:hypothetical protein